MASAQTSGLAWDHFPEDWGCVDHERIWNRQSKAWAWAECFLAALWKCAAFPWSVQNTSWPTQQSHPNVLPWRWRKGEIEKTCSSDLVCGRVASTRAFLSFQIFGGNFSWREICSRVGWHGIFGSFTRRDCRGSQKFVWDWLQCASLNLFQWSKCSLMCFHPFDLVGSVFFLFGLGDEKGWLGGDNVHCHDWSSWRLALASCSSCMREVQILEMHACQSQLFTCLRQMSSTLHRFHIEPDLPSMQW